jgi:hypothetical protein
MRASAIGGALLTVVLAAATGLHAQTTGNDRITAGIISHEIRNLGYSANVDADESGDPRVNTKVDGHSWQIYFYDCDKSGPLVERFCLSFQFFTDNNMPHPVPMQTIIRWNKNTTFAKAYVQQGNEAGCAADQSCAARIEVDVVTAGTGADPGRMFRTYFAIFKQRAMEFRRAIGAN